MRAVTVNPPLPSMDSQYASCPPNPSALGSCSFMKAARPRVNSHWLLSPKLPASPVRASMRSIQKSASVLDPAPAATSASKIFRI